jgi:transglutaminase-like putative cysteine protease
MVTGDKRAALVAVGVFVAALALIAPHAPAWCVAVAVGCAVWRAVLVFGVLRMSRPPKGAKFFMGVATALLVLAVLVSFQTLNGLAAGTALLVVMGALKVLESRTARDDAIVIGVSLILLLAACLANQGLLRLPLYLLFLWFACAGLAIVAHSATALTFRGALRLSTRALAMAIPLAVTCFVFFPRFQGNFFAFQGGGTAGTGLSDSMSPGAIEELVAEYDPAFRVRFAGELPPPEQRYWRGPVLNAFDGFTWRRDRSKFYVGTPVVTQGPEVRYRVTLEPSNKRWWFALDTVDRSPRRDVFKGHDGLLTALDPVNAPVSYDAVSHLETRATGELSLLGRRYETRLPTDRNPRARELAQRLRGASASDAAYTQVVLDWFRDNGLEYTLEPGATSIDSVDTVLFDNKRGFCGHFASAYANLMRAANIPARVVTGYLGGEWNPVGGYLIVRQSDAHAWTEVWLEGRGWVRVDPTGVVEPERLRRGYYDIAAPSSAGIALQRSEWFARLQQYWDGANQWWQERVIEFNLRSQLDLMRQFGFEDVGWEQLGIAFAGALLLWIAWISLALRRTVARARPDRLARLWLKATRKLARVAPARESTEGPLAYAARVAAARPEIGAEVIDIAHRYAMLRFGPGGATRDAQTELHELEQRIRKLEIDP